MTEAAEKPMFTTDAGLILAARPEGLTAPELRALVGAKTIGPMIRSLKAAAVRGLLVEITERGG